MFKISQFELFDKNKKYCYIRNMSKFTLKFLLLFTTVILLMFFSLVMYNKAVGQNRNIGRPSRVPPGSVNEYMNYQPQRKQKAPSPVVPILFIIIISSIFTYVVFRHIEKNYVLPLADIQDKIKKIDNGNYNIRFRTELDNNSIKDTYKALNSMLAGLRQKEKLQDNFIQTLVHDLRAPVMAQERAMDIISEDIEDNPLIKGIKENNEAYLNIINTIIDSIRVKEIIIEKTDLNLYSLVNTIINALQPQAKSKNISLINRVNPNFILWADYISINRIIMNLISNAIDNIYEGCRIEVFAQKQKAISLITIKDNGKGIDSIAMKQLFNKYISKNASGSKAVKGLGLYIVKDLINKNYGKIYIDSKINEYTKFCVELPNKGRNQ